MMSPREALAPWFIWEARPGLVARRTVAPARLAARTVLSQLLASTTITSTGGLDTDVDVDGRDVSRALRMAAGTAASSFWQFGSQNAREKATTEGGFNVPQRGIVGMKGTYKGRNHHRISHVI